MLLFIEPGRVFVTRSFRLPGPGWFPVQYYNRLGAVIFASVRTGAVVSGHRGRSDSIDLYIARERNIRIRKQMVGQIFIGIITRTCG